MQYKFFIRQTIEFRQPSFSKAPEAFYAVHMWFSPHKFVFMVEYPVMGIAIQNKTVIGFPAVCMDS